MTPEQKVMKKLIDYLDDYHDEGPEYEGWKSDGLKEAIQEAERLIAASQPEPFQARVAPWMDACFGPEISNDKLERGDRLLEEVLELLQSGDYPRERIRALEGYVYGREKGEPAQEAGGVQVTFAAYCLAHDIDMHEAGETELARVWTKVDVIRAKQAAKPTGSALPVAAPAADTGQAVETDTDFPSPKEWSEKLAEFYTWTGSAWLSGEGDEDLRTECRAFLCGLIGWFMAAEEMAAPTHPAPLDAERVREDERDRLYALSAEQSGERADLAWLWLGDNGAMKPAARATLRQKEGK